MRQKSLEQEQRSSSQRLSRQSSSNSPFTASQRQTEIQSTVLSYSQERYPSIGLATPHASPFSNLYRLSPFNPTTDQLLSASPQLPRKISLTPCRVLDAPNLSGNFYDSVIDWSTSNGLLAVGLGPQAYTWKSTGQVVKVVDVDTDDLSTAPTVSSVQWIDKVSFFFCFLLLFLLFPSPGAFPDRVSNLRVNTSRSASQMEKSRSTTLERVSKFVNSLLTQVESEFSLLYLKLSLPDQQIVRLLIEI